MTTTTTVQPRQEDVSQLVESLIQVLGEPQAIRNSSAYVDYTAFALEYSEDLPSELVSEAVELVSTWVQSFGWIFHSNVHSLKKDDPARFLVTLQRSEILEMSDRRMP